MINPDGSAKMSLASESGYGKPVINAAAGIISNVVPAALISNAIAKTADATIRASENNKDAVIKASENNIAAQAARRPNQLSFTGVGSDGIKVNGVSGASSGATGGNAKADATGGNAKSDSAAAGYGGIGGGAKVENTNQQAQASLSNAQQEQSAVAQQQQAAIAQQQQAQLQAQEQAQKQAQEQAQKQAQEQTANAEAEARAKAANENNITVPVSNGNNGCPGQSCDEHGNNGNHFGQDK